MKLYLPTGSTQISVRGMVINADSNGCVDVDPQVAADLISCGCTADAPPAPMTAQQLGVQAKAKLAAQKAYDKALVARDEAREALFATEGRGDNAATAKAKAALDTAEADVLTAQGAI